METSQVFKQNAALTTGSALATVVCTLVGLLRPLVGLILIVGGLREIVQGQIVFGLAALTLTPIIYWLIGYLSGVVALVLLAPGTLIERRRARRWLSEEG
jgi:hypothetical protein